MHVNGDGHDCRLKNLRFGTAAENVAMKKKHGTATGGTAAKYAVAYRVVGDTAWIVVDSRNAAQTATGVSRGKMRAFKPGKSYSGNGGVLYEFEDRSKPADFDEFVPILLSKEVYEHSVPDPTIVRALLHRTIYDGTTGEYFKIVSVFNDDELGRLCVEYFDKSFLDNDPDLDVDDLKATGDLEFSYVHLMRDERLVDEVEQTKKRKREEVDDLPPGVDKLPINKRYALNFD